MGKQWTPGQAKKFARELKLGRTYYTVQDQATNLAPWRDAQTYSEHVFTERSGFTAVPMTDGGTSAIQLCRVQGPVYDTPPRKMRNVRDLEPQVDGPLPRGYKGRLDPDEIRTMELRTQKRKSSWW